MTKNAACSGKSKHQTRLLLGAFLIPPALPVVADSTGQFLGIWRAGSRAEVPEESVHDPGKRLPALNCFAPAVF